MADKPGVIFDLCGTLGDDDGDIRHFMLYECTVAALRLLAEASMPVAIVTNQSGIARGRFTQQDFDAAMLGIESQLQARGMAWPRVYCCPHTADFGCECRKPAPGAARRAATDMGIDLTRSCVVGDSGVNDVLLGRAIGAKAALVRTGWGLGSLGEYRHQWSHAEADFIADDVLHAVKWILLNDGFKGR